MNLGLAFQLADDALDYGGTTEALGKNAGDDFREGKATLPLLLAIARSGPREAEFWERAIGRREQTEADFRRARELIVGTGALDATLDLAAATPTRPRRRWRASRPTTGAPASKAWPTSRSAGGPDMTGRGDPGSATCFRCRRKVRCRP
jgi:geranylgeranyl pyrophosphate synthase